MCRVVAVIQSGRGSDRVVSCDGSRLKQFQSSRSRCRVGRARCVKGTLARGAASSGRVVEQVGWCHEASSDTNIMAQGGRQPRRRLLDSGHSLRAQSQEMVCRVVDLAWGRCAEAGGLVTASRKSLRGGIDKKRANSAGQVWSLTNGSSCYWRPTMFCRVRE